MNTKFQTETIFTSSNYEMFKFLSFNRAVSKAHVNALVESIKRWGFQTTITVIETTVVNGIKEYYVIDGQHRFSAAKILGIPFKFLIVKLDNELDLRNYISDVNNNSKAWGTNQFLNIWASMGITEYSKMLKVQTETKVQITPLVKAYTGESSMKVFRKGKMKFPDEVNSDKIINQIMDLKDYLPNKAFCRRAIIDVMNDENYNHELVKPLIIRASLTNGFTENESELKRELKRIVRMANLQTA